MYIIEFVVAIANVFWLSSWCFQLPIVLAKYQLMWGFCYCRVLWQNFN